MLANPRWSAQLPVFKQSNLSCCANGVLLSPQIAPFVRPLGRARQSSSKRRAGVIWDVVSDCSGILVALMGVLGVETRQEVRWGDEPPCSGEQFARARERSRRRPRRTRIRRF
jgi:hypothetical protein